MQKELAAQHKRLVRLTINMQLQDELLVEGFTGTEGICDLFSFELSLLSQDNHLELKALIGQPALLEIELFDANKRFIHGHVSRFAHAGYDCGVARYSATLSPWLWMLGQRSDSRIFQEQTAVDVARLVFEHYAAVARYRIDLSNPAVSHSYLTQFNETDEQFIRRLFEEEGWLFFFEHSSDGHTLVITDDSSRLEPLAHQPNIRFQPPAGPETRDHVTQWHAERTLQSAAIAIQSFDYKHPVYGTEVMTMPTAVRQGQVPIHERYEFTGHYSHKGADGAHSLLRKRVDALKARGKIFRGASHCRALVPGYSFRLSGHDRHDHEPAGRQHQRPPGETSVDRCEFLLLRVEHVVQNNYLPEQQANYSNTFTCIRKHIGYLPERRTARPSIGGPLTAIVVGPESAGEVHTDPLARIKVRFHWQREQAPQLPEHDRHAQDTTWVRVAQPSAGAGFGHQFLPRIGQEVLVSFLAGDICRPVVTGVLYNAHQTPPRFSDVQHLPASRLLSGIKSREQAGRGYNELLFDDTTGSLRARLASTHQASALNLGRLVHPAEGMRSPPKGQGAELRTDAAIALRAAQGLLLTTQARHRAQNDQLEREALLELLGQCAELFQSLGRSASEHGAPALAPCDLAGLREALDRWPAADSQAEGEPVLAMVAEAGVVSATPASQAHYAGKSHHTIAQDHLQLTSGGATQVRAGKGLSVYAQDAGIDALAQRGKVRVQAQDDDILLNAHMNVHLSAGEGEVLVNAPTYRTQFQDLFDNRLDRHFAKNGGFFDNATNNLPDMYVDGYADFYRAVPQAFLSNALYMGKAPHRRYFVLAAHRLAMLVREIRRVSPDDTITIMGHSQGTLITLLAQALLVERGERCADCAIMVASPYSVLPGSTPKGSQTLQTLVDIVRNITDQPHPSPALDTLVCGRPGYGGRTGPGWSPAQGWRLGPDRQTVVFPERDNRGKVYLYFSHDDTTVALRDVSGIGTFGVPDTLPDGTPAMNALKERRFFQRLWSKRQRGGQPILLGNAPGPVDLRAEDERRSAGHNWGVSFLSQAGMDEGEKRLINGEALFPPHAPQMFGGEAQIGTPDKPGKDRPDAVSQHNALGNIEAKFQWIEIGTSAQRADLEAVRAQWNQGREPDDQTQALRQKPVSGNPMLNRQDHYRIEREETANEVRARMSIDTREWDDNSYHSAILRSPENHRWVTAMDVALGQAHCLDDPVMREVLLAISDWKMDEKRWNKLVELPGWSRLGQDSQALVEANHQYYQEGVFPSDELVPLTPPPLVRGQYSKGTGQ